MNAGEKAAYSKGYSAGSKRRKLKEQPERDRRIENAFWQRAFLAGVGHSMQAHTWKVGEKPITDIPGRVSLAVDFADEALKQAKNKGRMQ